MNVIEARCVSVIARPRDDPSEFDRNGRRQRRRLRLALLVVVAFGIGSTQSASSASNHSGGLIPSRLTARSSATRHFEYVFDTGGIQVYDIDHRNRYLGQITFPGLPIRGLVADPARATLFVAYGGPGGSWGTGSMLAYDLVTGRTLWQRAYSTGVDNIAITPDGRKLYMAVGEASGSSTWEIVDAANGRITGSIQGGSGPHETIVGPDGRYVYLGGVNTPYLDVASTSTGRIVKRVGPLHGPGVRPFTINATQTLAFTTSWSFLGFQVSSIRTGKVLYSVSPPGFRFDPAAFGDIPDHGISLSPDGRQLYLIDTPNGYVHVFDVSGLPLVPPRDIADIKLVHPTAGGDSWLQHSRDGRYVYVGLSGDVIDTASRKVVSYLAPLQSSTEFIEIDWRHGRPVDATSRYGVGYPQAG
jgi:DNA-binding beta-propeller fold protein YncE